MMTEHTLSLPWELEEDGQRWISDSTGHVVADPPSYEPTELWLRQAEFIIRCVNAHGELVAALEEAEAALRRFRELDNVRGSDGPCDCPACRACDSIRAAIAKAKGGTP